jgi:hypothetical protein
VVSRLKCEHFTQLLGYCLELNNRIVLYQFATMGSLYDILHGTVHKANQQERTHAVHDARGRMA